MTIDNALYRIDISAELEEKINDHIYLKFSAQPFNCSDTGTISLPVSDTVLVLVTIY